MDNSNPILDICGKKTLEYVCDCLAYFNRRIEAITLRAVGGSISKGVEISRILRKEFGANIHESKIESSQIVINDRDEKHVNLNTSCLKINLSCDLSKMNAGAKKYDLPKSKFVDFPIYHLLIDWQLAKNKKLEILNYNNTPLIDIVERNNNFLCKRSVNKEKDERSFWGIGDALYRCGLLLPYKWQNIAMKLSEYDDIILGIDTNILYRCTLSDHLLPALSLIDPKEYVHTPNWILFVVPSAVMHELEEAANIRSKYGYLELQGRMGFRALQEIIELGQSSDIPGISLVIVGAANPILDTRVELQGLREDFSRRERINEVSAQFHENVLQFTRSLKTSSGDMIIRDQFKDFLKQINFHKGTYFLTADKSNTALARAEGLHPIYFPFPTGFYENKTDFTPYVMHTIEGEAITIRVPIGKLIYELAVQFGTIKIRWNNEEIKIQCDTKGETLDNWICRRLRIEQEDLDKLIPDEYSGVFDLNEVSKIWYKLTENFVGLEEI